MWTTVDVDVADRCRNLQQPLLCSYAVRATSTEGLEDGKSVAFWTFEPMNSTRVSFETKEETSLAIAGHSLGKTTFQAISEKSKSGHTTRCRYIWRWIDPRVALHDGRGVSPDR